MADQTVPPATVREAWLAIALVIAQNPDLPAPDCIRVDARHIGIDLDSLAAVVAWSSRFRMGLGRPFVSRSTGRTVLLAEGLIDGLRCSLHGAEEPQPSGEPVASTAAALEAALAAERCPPAALTPDDPSLPGEPS